MFVASKSLAVGVLLAAALGLSACGTSTGDRAASGALIGGVAGAVAGALSDPCEVNLGHPIWADENASREDYYYRCGRYPPG